MREQPLPVLDRCQRLGPAPLIRPAIRRSQSKTVGQHPVDVSILQTREFRVAPKVERVTDSGLRRDSYLLPL